MFIYAQLNNQGYCIGISSVNEEIVSDSLVLLSEFDQSYIGRKYNGGWQDEYIQPMENIDDHDKITKETHSNVATTSFDNLINMDMLLAIDEKLNAIMGYLGI